MSAMHFDSATAAVRWAFRTEGRAIVSGSTLGQVSNSLGGDSCRNPEELSGYDRIAQAALIIRYILDMGPSGDALVARYTLPDDEGRAARKLEAVNRMVDLCAMPDSPEVAAIAIGEACYLKGPSIQEFIASGAMPKRTAYDHRKRILDRFYQWEESALFELSLHLRIAGLI